MSGIAVGGLCVLVGFVAVLIGLWVGARFERSLRRDHAEATLRAIGRWCILNEDTPVSQVVCEIERLVTDYLRDMNH